MAGQIDIGRCNRVGWYEGVHLLTAVTPSGALTCYGLAPASTKEQHLAESFLAQRASVLPIPAWPGVGPAKASGLYVTDKVFEGTTWQQHWRQEYGATLLVLPKRRDPLAWSPALRLWHAGLRQILETVYDRLLTTFGLEHERPHALDGLLAPPRRLRRLAQLCLWLNGQLGRPPLAFADLIGNFYLTPSV